MTLLVIASAALVALFLLAVLPVVWLSRRPTREQRRAMADVEARMHERGSAVPTSDRFPHVYIGPDTGYGLRSGSACRVTGHKMGSVSRFVTTDGQAWFAPNAQVVIRRRALELKRHGQPVEDVLPVLHADTPPGPRQVAPKGEVCR